MKIVRAKLTPLQCMWLGAFVARVRAEAPLEAANGPMFTLHYPSRHPDLAAALIATGSTGARKATWPAVENERPRSAQQYPSWTCHPRFGKEQAYVWGLIASGRDRAKFDVFEGVDLAWWAERTVNELLRVGSRGVGHPSLPAARGKGESIPVPDWARSLINLSNFRA